MREAGADCLPVLARSTVSDPDQRLSDPDQRLEAIDGLRAVAVAMVFLFHAYPTYFPGGFVGVDVFFVISGFVITRALMRESINLKRFYQHRFLRIIPPVLPVLVFAIVVPASGGALASPGEGLIALASLMNWARALDITNGQYLGHFWSLSVEEQFYLIWPISLLLLLRSKLTPATGLILAVVLLSAWQVAMFVHSSDVERVYNGLDTRASQLLIGCLLFFILPKKALPALVLIAPLAVLAVLMLVLDWQDRAYLTVGIPVVGLLTGLIVAHMAAARSPLHRIFETPLLQWGGSRSYALYLWHYPILGMLFSYGNDAGVSPMISVVISFVLTCAAAEMSFWLVERPARRLRDKFEKSAKESLA